MPEESKAPYDEDIDDKQCKELGLHDDHFWAADDGTEYYCIGSMEP